MADNAGPAAGKKKIAIFYKNTLKLYVYRSDTKLERPVKEFMPKSKRILPYRNKGKAGTPRLSHEQVTHAILAFQKRGGLIELLPPEPDIQRKMVRNRWGSMYEVIFDQV